MLSGFNIKRQADIKLLIFLFNILSQMCQINNLVILDICCWLKSCFCHDETNQHRYQCQSDIPIKPTKSQPSYTQIQGSFATAIKYKIKPSRQRFKRQSLSMCITKKPLNLHFLFEKEHQILYNALSVLFKYFIYAPLFSKQHFRIANCIQANEKLVTPRFTPLSGSFITFLSAGNKREGRKKIKIRHC